MRRLAVRRNVAFESDLQVGAGCFINAVDQLTIGPKVAIGTNVWISCNGSIGAGVLIGSQVGIVSRYEHNLGQIGVMISQATTLGAPESRARDARDEVHIGDDVWIGFNATILSGVTIGRGAIIAAGSVVSRDVDAYAVVAGNPARPVSERMTTSDRIHHERGLASS
ncbi:acyltransferase [Brevundimonas nasdae]|nr:DapH/DapD/GlmU-related protein [Brevundimonas nasdae]